MRFHGAVMKKEFGRAMPVLGLHVPKGAADELFERLDPHGSGSIEYETLDEQLIRLSPELAACRCATRAVMRARP